MGSLPSLFITVVCPLGLRRVHGVPTHSFTRFVGWVRFAVSALCLPYWGLS